MEEFMLPCLNKSLFGIDCMGCGAQRALVMVLQGNYVGAFKMYPAIYSILLLLVFLVLNVFVRFKQEWPIKIGMILLNALIIIFSYILKITQALT